MLQLNRPGDTGQSSDLGLESADFLAGFLQVLRHQFPTIVAILAACIAVSVLYLFTAPPKYTATAAMIIDTKKVQLFQQSVLGELPIDSAAIETQVEILKSESISRAVIKDQKLLEDSEFIGSGGGVLDAIVNLVASYTPASPQSEEELMRSSLSRFQNNRTVKRLGLTYVMEIGFTSLNPNKAAQIANSIADSYIVDQLEAKYQATRRASVWLQDRIKELRAQASAAQRAVVDFKQQNNIVDAGGRLMNDQQLAEVNSQMILARAATAEAKARLDRINDILKQEIPDASVADALKNETIVKLRGQYVDLASRESIFSTRYGRDHLAVVNLRTQMQEIKKNITDELKRIQQSQKSDYDIALTREDSIKASLAGVVTESQSTNQAQVQLRELESSAQSFQAMYDNFLQRYMETVQQQSFPITDARVITPASAPFKKSSPKTLLILAASVFGGLLLGLSAAFGRDLVDNVFRTGAQVEKVLNTTCIAMFPDLKAQRAKSSGRKMSRLDKSQKKSGSDALLRYVVENPLSRFSEAVRSLKVSIDLNAIVRENRVIAICSSLPSEGKSTLCSNLAQLIAQGGATVALIDMDFRNPSLSRALSANGSRGLVDLVARKATLEDLLVIDAATKLAFLPAGEGANFNSAELLASKAMQETLAYIRTRYDYVVLDMPPMAPVVDVRVTTKFVDCYIFVVEWGKTKIDVVRHNLKNAPEIHERLLGVVLNKADTSIVSRYESYLGDSYYSKYYAKYGYQE